ncbi:hypothetical protein, partial [Enterococcus faecalis]|uniref:hypothetical protein n=1 Tax=Enterococcus faecalis TaxID=1351 RepID=UPI00254CB2A8
TEPMANISPEGGNGRHLTLRGADTSAQAPWSLSVPYCYFTPLFFIFPYREPFVPSASGTNNQA